MTDTQHRDKATDESYRKNESNERGEIYREKVRSSERGGERGRDEAEGVRLSWRELKLVAVTAKDSKLNKGKPDTSNYREK